MSKEKPKFVSDIISQRTRKQSVPTPLLGKVRESLGPHYRKGQRKPHGTTVYWSSISSSEF